MLTRMANWGPLLRQALDVGLKLLSPRQAPVADRARRAPAGGDRAHASDGGGTRNAPTADRARAVSYAPDLDGSADPGEVVWAWVPFEEEDGRGKDRPLLVVGRDEGDLLGLMLSSQPRRSGEPGWISIGSGAWDREGRESFVRLDRVLEVAEHGIRREGAVLDHDRFERVAAQLRGRYGWT
jgi:hypothetical protein